jgi:hypothetical protein
MSTVTLEYVDGLTSITEHPSPEVAYSYAAQEHAALSYMLRAVYVNGHQF